MPLCDTVKCFNFAGSNIHGFSFIIYSWGLKFVASQFIDYLVNVGFIQNIIN